MTKRIMLVDDEPDVLMVISHGLKKRGYEVFNCRDGRQALIMGPDIMPDLIILDLGLPFINGNEVARIFKADQKMRHIPVLLISSVTEGLGDKSAACGADGWLPKPFKFTTLTDMMEKYLK